MNRLKKTAIQEFVAICIFMCIIIPCFIDFVMRNTQGFDYVLIGVIVGVPTGLFVYLIENKKLKQLDERERKLYQKAIQTSYGVFIFYLLGFAVITFFLIGGGKIPVVFMPVMLFAGLFFAQCTQSFIILFRCAKEDDE